MGMDHTMCQWKLAPGLVGVREGTSRSVAPWLERTSTFGRRLSCFVVRDLGGNISSGLATFEEELWKILLRS